MGMNKFPTKIKAKDDAISHVQGNSQPWYAISPGIPAKHNLDNVDIFPSNNSYFFHTWRN